MTITERRLYNRIRRRALALQPELARKMLAAFDVIRGALTEAELVRAINAGYVEALIDAVTQDRVIGPAFMPLRAQIDRATIEAGASWQKTLPARFMPAVFDVLNPRVLDAVKNLDTRVVQGLATEVRATVKAASTAGIELGWHPRKTARLVRDVIGLAPNQVNAIQNFRGMLEAGDRTALTRALRDRRFDKTLEKMLGAGGQGLQPAQIDKMTGAYQQRMIAFNTETHTRTIANDSQKLAQRLSWTDAGAQGFVDTSRLMRTWVSTGDDRVRPEHVEMNGESVPFDAPTFSNGESIPGDSTYGCRCLERISLVTP